MKCEACEQWVLQRKNTYDDGSEVVTYTSPKGKGHCEALDLDTDPSFGCTAFIAGGHVKVTAKTGAPWHHFIMIKCPACNGDPGGGRCRCAGTGLVRFYDDGYVGEEFTRRHPKEKEVAAQVDPGTVLQPVEKANVL